MPKGVYPRNKEMMTGKHMRGRPSTFKGRHHTQKTKEKIRKAKFGQNRDDKSPSWRGGEIVNQRGYVFIKKHGHPFCNHQNYVRRPRLVMEEHLGRYLTPQEVVHHINGIRDDDRIENLMLFPNHSEHMKYHRKNS